MHSPDPSVRPEYLGMNALHSDLHELRADSAGAFYPSTYLPDLQWREVGYATYARAPADGFAEVARGAGMARHPEAAEYVETTARLIRTAPPRPRSGHTLTAISGRLLLIGGEAEVSDFVGTSGALRSP